LLAALLVVYGPALAGGFLWDDDAHVTPEALRSWSGLARTWFDLGATQQYYPLLHTSFWIQHRLWGDNVVAYHLVGVLLHAVNGVLLRAVLVKLGLSRGEATGAALVWALHPVMVESVAWITEQKNTLSGAFYLGSFLAWLRFDMTRRRSDWILATLLFVLGLFSKTVTATLPAAILVVTWWRRGALSFRHDVRPLLPWFVLGAAGGLLTAWVERQYIGAQGAAFDLSWIERGLLAGRVGWFYLASLAWPLDLMFIYPRWNVQASDPVAWLYPAATLGTLALFWLLRGRMRAPLAGALFFLGTLFPVLGFFNVYPFLYSFVADHFQYLASLGVVVPLVVAGHRHGSARWGARATASVVGLVLLVLAALTWQQSRSYASAETLYRATLRKNPGSWLTAVHLGTIVQGQGRLDEALELYRRAAAVHPEFEGTHINTGNVLVQAGRIDEALEAYRRALALKPDDALANHAMAGALARLGRWEEVVEHERRAIASGTLGTLAADAHMTLGGALLQLGRRTEGIDELEVVLRLRAGTAEEEYGLAALQAAEGRNRAAMAGFRRALALRPDYPEALNGLAWLIVTDDAERRDPAAAIPLAERAVALTGRKNGHYLDTLAAAYAAAGRREEALRAVTEALVLARADGDAAFIAELEARLASLD
jgi:tetratricopeptide (TPR) repeat protein